MTITLSISPDFSPKHIAGWFIFNTWLQRQMNFGIHLELYDSFEQQREAFKRDELDLIYANPFDASFLVREKGFRAIAAPLHKSDETIIATSIDSPISDLESLKEGTRIAATDDPDINMLGMIMLEPADLTDDTVDLHTVDTYVLVAKQLIDQKADVGFFLKESYDDLSDVIKKQLRILLASDIQVIRHVLLAGSRLADHHEQLTDALSNMQTDPKGAGVLQAMGLDGWESQDQEDAEFMIDLMDTLNAH